MLKKLIATLGAAFILAAPLTVIAPATAAGGPAIFLVPHQDDEVLTYGAAIKEHLLGGRNVRVVLLSDGSSSGECKVARDGRFGHPNFDLTDGVAGEYTQADRDACTAWRDAEFLDAMAAMRSNVDAGSGGVGHLVTVIRGDRAVDGNITARYVTSVVNDMAANFRGASFKAMSHYEGAHMDAGGHLDHDAIGDGLRAATGTNDKRYYAKPELWEEVRGTVVRYPINEVLDAYRTFGQYSVNGTFCEQYGLAKSGRARLDNGEPCDLADYQKTRGGATSRVHQ